MGMSISQTVYDGGLASPVMGSQVIFRAVMEAFANPGHVTHMHDVVSPPAPLGEAAAAFLVALADYDTPVWFEDEGHHDASTWLAFHTGAPVTSDPATAAFAVLAPRSPVEAWSRLPIGTSSYPDRSATLLLPVESLDGGRALRLSGPGIESTAAIAPIGLPDGFLAVMTDNRTPFPLGFDVLLTCGSRLVGLPRTTRVREA